jgi:hypothetical protein
VSARHQVKRLHRTSTGFAVRITVRQKKEVFFIGADPKVRNFTGAFRPLKFGPDVFADALVPRRGVCRLAFRSPKNLLNSRSRARSRFYAGPRCGNGYCFAKRQGKPIPRTPG